MSSLISPAPAASTIRSRAADPPAATRSRARVGAVSATVGGHPAEIVFAGMTPGFVGLAQLNLKIPSLAPGDYPLVVTINGDKSNAGTISVK